MGTKEKFINSKSEDPEGNHNLETAGDVIGLNYDTSKYDPNYNRKKGMRFFLVFIVVLFLTSIVLVSLRNFPDVQIMYAADNNIVIQNIKTNTFGKSRVNVEVLVEYDYDNYVFDMMKGKAAQIAFLVKKFSVELLVADTGVLESLVIRRYLSDIGVYLDSSYEDKLVKLDYKSPVGLLYINYGARLEENRYFEYVGKDNCIAIINGDISKLNINYKTPMVAEFAGKLIKGEPFSTGIRDYHKIWEGKWNE